MYIKSNKGITLIALVITIIVLLILAGISISALTGENGIINKAKEAKKKTELSGLKEEVALKVTDYKLYEGSNIEEYLEKIPNSSVEKMKEDTFYVTKGSATVTVYNTGEVVEGKSLWDLTSKCPELKDGNWYIYTASQLKFLADYVNNGCTLTDEQNVQVTDAGYDLDNVILTEETTIYLMNDIDLGARVMNGEWETDENEELEWMAIGNGDENNLDKRLIANFEGNNHTIRGVYINTDTHFNGVFGNSNTVKNLTIKNSYIKGGACTAGITGALRNGVVENCHNIDTTVILIENENNEMEFDTIGGVVGQAGGDVVSCSNSGKIIAIGSNSGGSSSAGGVVGSSLGVNVKKCHNTGDVEGNGSRIGGIVGNANSYTIITSSYNEGEIIGKGFYTGGVVGILAQENGATNSKVENCYNTGKVKGNGYTAGVIGGAGSLSVVENCYNTGIVQSNLEAASAISDDYQGTAGIVGSIGSSSTINNCYNTGNITGNNTRTGGVLGCLGTYSTISNCYNTGDVEGKVEHTGGVVGLVAQNADVSNSTVENCYNTGNVSGDINVGGIIGWLGGANGNGTVNNCYSKGNITGTSNVGAVIGGHRGPISLNILNDLYYLNTVGIGAINGVNYEDSNIKSTTKDIVTFEQFLEWIQ